MKRSLVCIVAMCALTLACSSEDTSPAQSPADVGAEATTTDTGAAATDSGAADTGTASDSASGDSTAGETATTDAPAGDTGGCNSVTNAGAVVSETAGAGTKPAAAGGTIVAGTYVLTKHEVFAPSAPDANTRRRTLVITGTKAENVQNDSGSAEVRTTGTFATTGSTLTFSVTCPATLTVTVPYTATPTTLLLFDNANPNDVFTYTKQ